MKKLIISMVLLCAMTYIAAQDLRIPISQNAIYTINNQNEVVPNSRYIEPFYWDDQATPFSQVYSKNLSLPGFSKPCTVKLYNYKNGEYDPGYYCIVDIEFGGVRSLRIAQSNAWDKFAVDYEYTNDLFKVIKLDDKTYALLFTGYHYASNPELLTIVILRDSKATLVFNEHRHIMNIQESPLQIRLVSQFSDGTDQNARNAVNEMIWQDGNVLRYSGVK